MPIEIRELHIKINVNDSKGNSSGESQSSDGDMVAECVEQVLETIKKQKER